MKVAVVGAGAVGAYVGAMLARGGTDVSLIARGANLEAMRSTGLRVITENAEFTVRVPATDNPREIGEVDTVFLGLKAHHYAGAAPLLEPLLGPDTAVVAAQNGIPWWYFYKRGGEFDGRRIEAVDPGGAVSRVIPPRRAIGCVVYSSTELEGPGVVRHVEGFRFPIGEPDGQPSGRTRAFSQAMRAGGLKAPVVSKIRDHIWLKLMGNVVFNPLSALTRATVVQMCEYPPTRDLAARVMAETQEIACALGCNASGLSIQQRIEGARLVGQHRTSMLQDIEAGKQLELAALVTAVVELADLAQIAAPSLRTLSAAAELLERTRHPNQSLLRQPVG